MSNLKYQSLEQLEESRSDAIRYINKLERNVYALKKLIKLQERKLNLCKQKIGGQNVRLEWINKYIDGKDKHFNDKGAGI